MPVQHLALAFRDGNNCLNNFLMFQLHFSKSSLERNSSLSLQLWSADATAWDDLSKRHNSLCIVRYQTIFSRRCIGTRVAGMCSSDDREFSRELNLHAQPARKRVKTQEICQAIALQPTDFVYDGKVNWNTPASQNGLALVSHFSWSRASDVKRSFLVKRRKFCFVDLVLEIWPEKCCCCRQSVGACLSCVLGKANLVFLAFISNAAMWCNCLWRWLPFAIKFLEPAGAGNDLKPSDHTARLGN